GPLRSNHHHPRAACRSPTLSRPASGCAITAAYVISSLPASVAPRASRAGFRFPARSSRPRTPDRALVSRR
ncbi:MAG TPA: hypothetical protein VIL82_04155, partial [Solirubrobacteraceae bacterium]